jgi:alkaline phosphatase
MNTNNILNRTTGSASAGTAMACGVKTGPKRVAVTADGKAKLPSIAEMAKAVGMKVGIVSTVPIDHATPAAFYAKEASRNSYRNIALQLPVSGFDYFAGGEPYGNAPKSAQEGKTVVELAEQAGYTVVTDRKALLAAKPGGKLWASIATDYPKKGLVYEMDRKGAFADQPSVAEMTAKGIELLDNPKGFFLMVEGGRIDWAGHKNDAAAMIHDTIAMDQAVAEAMAFYKKHPRETLIVVTADHDTGGLKILDATKIGQLKRQTMSFAALGAAYDRLKAGNVPAAKAMETILPAAGLTDATDEEKTRLVEQYNKFLKNDRAGSDVYNPNNGYARLPALIVAERAGLGWTSGHHTPAAIPTTAIGAGAYSFKGTYENDELFFKIARAMQLAVPKEVRDHSQAARAQMAGVKDQPKETHGAY